MNTLHVSPPVSASAESSRHPVPPLRPSALDRAAMRLGLRLLLWGRHRARRRATIETHARRQLADEVRRDYDRTIAHAASTRLIS